MLSSWLSIKSDKTVTLFIGKVELGQGVLTALGQICADELGVDYGRLSVISGDTARSPNQGTTSGSQTMSDGGTAVQAASAEVREILFGLASAKLGQPVSGMKVEDGTITAANGKTITYWELVTGKELERKATGARACDRSLSIAISVNRTHASTFRQKSPAARFMCKT